MTQAKSKERDKAKDSLVLFTLKGERYTIENTSVVQILHSLSITQVANATPYLLGSTVFQGEVLPVINLQIFFYGFDKNQKEISSGSQFSLFWNIKEYQLYFQLKQLLVLLQDLV